MRAFPVDMDKAIEYSATVVVRTDFSDPAGAVSVDVGIGNMDFEEFAEAAAATPDGVFRGWPE